MKLGRQLKRTTPREQLCGELKSAINGARKEKISVDLKTVSPTDLSEVKTEKGQALTPSVLTGIRAAIHRHLTCAPLSRNINILQDSEFTSANKMFEAKAKLFTKQCETKTQIIYSVRRYAEIESIFHGRAEQGRRLEKCGEVG